MGNIRVLRRKGAMPVLQRASTVLGLRASGLLVGGVILLLACQ